MSPRRLRAHLVPAGVLVLLFTGACTGGDERSAQAETPPKPSTVEATTAYLLTTPVPGLRAAPQVACTAHRRSLAVYRAEGPAGDVAPGDIAGVTVVATAQPLDAVLDTPSIGVDQIDSSADPGTATNLEIDGNAVVVYERTLPGGSGIVSRVATWIADGHRLSITIVETDVDLEAVVQSVALVPVEQFDTVADHDGSWCP